jgi:IclR family pca regulon transcriptional regulator
MGPDMADESVQSVERAISLLLALDATTPQQDAATLSERTGLSRSTVYRLLGTLEQTGMVHKRGSLFELGQNVLRLAGGYRAANHISLDAKTVLDDLAQEVQTGVTLAVLDGDVVVTVETGNAVNGHYVLQPHELGRRIPAMATSVGRMLLAFEEPGEGDGSARASLDDESAGASARIRREGYVMTSGLLEAGVRTIAVPVYDNEGVVVAGLGILADANRTSAEQLAGVPLTRLRAAADRLTQLVDAVPTTLR